MKGHGDRAARGGPGWTLLGVGQLGAGGHAHSQQRPCPWAALSSGVLTGGVRHDSHICTRERPSRTERALCHEIHEAESSGLCRRHPQGGLWKDSPPSRTSVLRGGTC